MAAAGGGLLLNITLPLARGALAAGEKTSFEPNAEP